MSRRPKVDDQLNNKATHFDRLMAVF